MILLHPEEFEDPERWWAAITPLLDRPRTAVIVCTRDANTVPDEVRRALAVRVAARLDEMDKDQLELAMGQEVPEGEVEKAGQWGLLALQDGEFTVLILGQGRARERGDRP